MLLQTNFLVLIAVEAIENDKRQAEARGKGETGTKYKELVPSFFGWVGYGDGRGGEEMVGAGKLTEI